LPLFRRRCSPPSLTSRPPRMPRTPSPPHASAATAPHASAATAPAGPRFRT
jgi:hypothetical protein